MEPVRNDSILDVNNIPQPEPIKPQPSADAKIHSGNFANSTISSIDPNINASINPSAPKISNSKVKLTLKEKIKHYGKELIRSLPGLIKDFIKTTILINAAIYLPRLLFAKLGPTVSKFITDFKK